MAYEGYAALVGAAHTRRSGSRLIALDDWRSSADGTEHYLVISCADPAIADPAFKHLQTGAARMAGKADEEAVDKSAHLLIQAPAANAAPNAPALMLLTAGAGVSPAKVATLLAGLVKLGSRLPAHKPLMRATHPDGVAGKTVAVRIGITAAGHQSRELATILRSGKLEGMELISESRAAWDQDPGFVVVADVLKVKAVNIHGAMTLGRLGNLFKKPNGDRYDKARIIFKETPNGKKESELFDTSDLERAFTKKDVIRFETDISSKYSKVSMTVIDKMRELL